VGTHSVWIYNYNCVPNARSGLTPLELVTKERSDWTSSAAMCGDAWCMFYKQNLQGVSNDRGDTLLSSEMKYEYAHLEAAKKERKTPT
jgi:hypothetical protein